MVDLIHELEENPQQEGVMRELFSLARGMKKVIEESLYEEG